tara:strand:+ start:227 stop:625 length:399 start_codon:yes stop_codon:yes gene_type:complete
MDWKSEKGKKLLRDLELKVELAEAMGWTGLTNLSWWQIWDGGWCLHGKPSRVIGPSGDNSINFELPVSITDSSEALKAAIAKVKAHPERLKEKVRWYCPEHEWEEVLPRGEMHSGCPLCGGYYCEPWTPKEE